MRTTNRAILRSETAESSKEEQRKGTEDKGLTETLKGVGESVKKFFSGQVTKTQSEGRSDPYGGGGP